MTTPEQRLAELIDSPDIPTTGEYGQAIAETLPAPTAEQIGRLMAYFPARQHNQQDQRKPA